MAAGFHHRLRRRAADLGAGQRQAQVRGLGVVAADLQAMGRGGAETDLVAAERGVDGEAQVVVRMVGPGRSLRVVASLPTIRHGAIRS